MDQTRAAPSPEKRALGASNPLRLPGGEEIPPPPPTKSSSKRKKKKKKTTAPPKKANPIAPPEGYTCQLCKCPGHYLSSCPTIERDDPAKMDHNKTEQAKGQVDTTVDTDRSTRPTTAKTQSTVSKKVQETLASFADSDEEKEEKPPVKEPSPEIVLGVTEKKVVGNPDYSEFVQNLFKNRPNPYINKPKRKTALEMWDEADKRMESLKLREAEESAHATTGPQTSTQAASDTAKGTTDITTSKSSTESSSGLIPQSAASKTAPKAATEIGETVDDQVMSE